ncbi:MAG: ABC transporter substrate-binding protein, partial [Kiloniellales bacterium]|nr:ABC transporter substrate-binding protein [Kiloniellales bacterium]
MKTACFCTLRRQGERHFDRERDMPREAKDLYLKRLRKAVIEGQLDRRGFMMGAIAAGLSVTAATNLYSRAAKAAPNKGGRFRVALDDGNTTDSVDPATYESTFQITMAHTHRSYLTEISPDNVVIPELAESWEASPDATTWTMKLRKDVEFHNGKTFDANDAAASLNYHRGEDTKSAAKALLESVEDISVDDPHTLVVKLKSGSADFPYVLTDYHLVMLPSDGEGNALWQDGVGAGGYVLNDFEPGIRARMTRHPNYWKEGRAHFDEVEFFAIPDVNARQTGLTTDELDAMIEVDLKTAKLLGRRPEIEVIEVPSGTHVTMAMHVDVPPFDNNDVRLALKYVMDREASLQKVLKGHGTIGNDHPIAP